jgi:rhodanese-related sulfurtransferase
MLTRIRHLVVALLAVVLATGVTHAVRGQTPSNQSARDSFDVSANQLHEWAQHKDFVLVNVHIPYAGDIPGTDLSIPFDKIGENLEKLPADKTAKLVLYCRSGAMSEQAWTTLQGFGYQRVYNLVGGMRGWSAAGYQLEQRGGTQPAAP